MFLLIIHDVELCSRLLLRRRRPISDSRQRRQTPLPRSIFHWRRTWYRIRSLDKVQYQYKPVTALHYCTEMLSVSLTTSFPSPLILHPIFPNFHHSSPNAVQWYAPNTELSTPLIDCDAQRQLSGVRYWKMPKPTIFPKTPKISVQCIYNRNMLTTDDA